MTLNRLMPCLAFWLLGLLLAGLPPGATAQADSPAPGSLRERLAERLQQRQAAGQAPQAAPSTAPQPGTQAFTLTHAGQTRHYLLHLPPVARTGAPLPLLMAFHGGGGDMRFQAGEHYGLTELANRAGFIAVFPNGISRFPGGRLATWNAGACCGAARDQQADDVGFVRALLAQVQQQVRVDPQRVFATGMSNGGMMSHRLACEMADSFRAIAAVAGTDNTLRCQPSGPVSVLMIHARDDTHVLFNGGAGADAFRDRSQVTDFTSVPETRQRWLARNQCSGPATPVLERPGARCEVNRGCAGGSQVQLCVTDSGGHSWPGAAKVRLGKAPASQALSANEVMWDFFQRVSAR